MPFTNLPNVSTLPSNFIPLPSQLTALGVEVSIRVQRDESGNAYSAWQLRQSFGYNLQIRQSCLGDHQATRVHPLHIVHEIKNY